MNKILIVGPVFPYKGGISHYTGLLHKSLSSKYKVRTLSYSLQYPKFLFKEEQKDFRNDAFKINNVKFNINTINPLNWISCANLINKMMPDLIIIQWWHPYFAPCYWSILKLLKKNIKVIFLCHNVIPHERFLFDEFIIKKLLCKADGYIVHSKTEIKNLLSIVKNAKYKLNVLPSFNNFNFSENLTKSDARKRLNLKNDTKVLLFFGFIRKYKGLHNLINSMPAILKKLDNVKLLIVGEFRDDKSEYLELIKRNKLKDNIIIVDDYIQDKEIENYFVASDVVVLPYETATQSGIVQIAYSFKKPVIATNTGGLPEVVINNKTGYIVEPSNKKELSDAVISYFKEDKENEFILNIEKESHRYSWDCLVESIEELYSNL